MLPSNPAEPQSVLTMFISALGQSCRVIDLSQSLGPGVPVFPGFPDPSFEVMFSQKTGAVANVEVIHFVPHSGTHMDAPYHFFSALRRVDELPVDCLMGAAVVVDLSMKKGAAPISASDIQDWERLTGEAIQPGDIVLLRTDHSMTWKVGAKSDEFWKNGWPYLEPDAADYLLSKSIKALGVETFSPDLELPGREGADVHYTHQAFFPKGILILENLAHLEMIPSLRCLVIALPLKLAGGSGSPVRVVAVVED
jgi:arylformamidase